MSTQNQQNQINTITCEFNETQVKNLFIFLDRVSFKGFQEVTALNEILTIINKSSTDQNKKSE